jgi:hypothetical protein
MPSLDRHYRVPSAARWYMRFFIGSVALVGLALVLDSHGGLSPVAIAIGWYAMVAALAVWGERLMTRAGLYESADGIKVVNSFGSTSCRWEFIARFEQSRKWPKSRVFVVVRNGAVIPIVGTAQGARIAWQDGDTNDIVGVLNERLDAWRSEHAAGATAN